MRIDKQLGGSRKRTLEAMRAQGARRRDNFTRLTDHKFKTEIKILGAYASLSRFGCIVRHFVARS